MGVDITGVDERDSNWECRTPRFRVYLHGSGTASTHGWTDTYDVTGADVRQVIDWARSVKPATDSRMPLRWYTTMKPTIGGSPVQAAG